MIKYEKDTGKKAIWRGRVTKGYKKWMKGEKIYDIDKRVIGILVSEETKTRWESFAKENNYSTISKFLRKAINSYIKFLSRENSLKNISQFTHDLKEPLTSIQGYLQLILENDQEGISQDNLTMLKEIYAQSLLLEKKIDEISENEDINSKDYDILIIEDNANTVQVLTTYFGKKGYSCVSASTGLEGIEKLNKFSPKLVLLDIILPDINGYEVCKRIKNNKKDIPIFYITAIPKSEVSNMINETGANGFFLKPFKFPQFEVLYEYL